MSNRQTDHVFFGSGGMAVVQAIVLSHDLTLPHRNLSAKQGILTDPPIPLWSLKVRDPKVLLGHAKSRFASI